jgi:phage baseplate assembly protein gpV
VGRLGLAALPRVGDLVVTVFAGGDLNAPVVVGSVYDEKNQPPVGKPEEVVYQPPDAGDSAIRRLHLELASGTTLTVDDDKVALVSGGTEVTISRDGDVAIKAAGKIALESGGEMTLEAGGDLKLNARGNVTVSAATAATLEGTASAKVKAPSISVAGMTQFSAA